MTKAKTVPEILEICQGYRDGLSCRKLAALHGMTDVGVHLLLRRAGVPTRPRGEAQPLKKMTAEVTARAAALYAEGESLKNISNTVGATPVAIRRALRKAGHVLRSKTREKHWAALEQESGQLMCSTCLELKDPSAFSVNSNRGKTLRNREYECKECQRWRTRERAYGITKGEYQTRLQAQGGLCGICKKAWNGNEANPDLVVDHDHRTGKVRGLLCPHCNHLLGHSMDSPEVLRAAAAYLETHRAASS